MPFLPVRPDLLLVQSRSLYGFPVSTNFLDLVLGPMIKQVCRQTLKSLAAECLFGVRLGLLLDFYLRGLFWLLAGLHLVGPQGLLHAKYILEALEACLKACFEACFEACFILKSTSSRLGGLPRSLPGGLLHA